MLINIQADQVLSTFGLTGVTYLPQPVGGHLHEGTARFLASVGLPSSKLFSTKLDLDDTGRLKCRASLKTVFDADGATLPEEAELWEVLGQFQYATIALDPQTGQVYSFAEGEESYVPMHKDVSSLLHALTAVKTGLAELKKLPHHDNQAHAEAIERLRDRIVQIDETPFASDDGEWSRFFEEITFGMWG